MIFRPRPRGAEIYPRPPQSPTTLKRVRAEYRRRAAGSAFVPCGKFEAARRILEEKTSFLQDLLMVFDITIESLYRTAYACVCFTRYGTNAQAPSTARSTDDVVRR